MEGLVVLMSAFQLPFAPASNDLALLMPVVVAVRPAIQLPIVLHNETHGFGLEQQLLMALGGR